MQAIKNSFVKVKSKLESAGSWIANKYRNNRKKCKGILLSLGLLFLLAGLIVGSYKFVDSVSLGSPINYTSETIMSSTVTNYGSFLGLNTYYRTVPNTNFLISFQTEAGTTKNSFPPVRARVIEGTLLEIDVHAKVKINTTNLKDFFQNYGFEQIGGYDSWLIYIKEKIRNTVVQKVAAFRFYQISNKAVSNSINSEFNSYGISFPFIVKIIGINIHYPQQTLKSNNTLGIKLLQQQSLLKQLKTQRQQIQDYILKYQNSTINYAQKRADIDGKMTNRENAVKLSSDYWVQGVQTFNKAVYGNSTLLQKYLEIYFNSLYNVTYRIQSLQPFQI